MGHDGSRCRGGDGGGRRGGRGIQVRRERVEWKKVAEDGIGSYAVPPPPHFNY